MLLADLTENLSQLQTPFTKFMHNSWHFTLVQKVAQHFKKNEIKFALIFWTILKNF